MAKEPEVANGFAIGEGAARQLVPLLGAAAGLAAPLVGALYGVVRVGYEEYYRGLGLSPEVIGLGQAAIVSRVGVILGLLGLLMAAFCAFGLTIYRLTAPLIRRSTEPGPALRRAAWLGAPFLVLVGAVVLSGALFWGVVDESDLRFWVAGSVSAGMIGLQLSWLANVGLFLPTRPAQVIRFLYVEGLPKVGWLVLVAVAGGYLGISIGNYWEQAAETGARVRQTGHLASDYLHVTVAPARIVPKSSDPLRVCDGVRRAVLVGRHDGTSFVLLLPRTGSDMPSEVLPLLDSEYGVAATLGEPQTCNPRAP